MECKYDICPFIANGECDVPPCNECYLSHYEYMFEDANEI